LDNDFKVFIITEGSRDTGFGHITRCTSLYQAFEEKGVLPIFLINGDETVKDLLNNRNHDIFNWLTDEKRLLTFTEHADVVIIDSYLADYELYEKISGLVKGSVYIDDNKRIDYPRGVVVNGTVYAEELNYPKKIGVDYLLGSQYIPIRKEFWDVPDKRIREHIETIMITFGGDDMRNLTPKVLRIINDNFPSINKKVVIGRGFKNALQIEAQKDDKTYFIHYPDAEGIKQVMLESDIAVSAAGQTLYELARVGVPTIAVAVADNQMNNVKGWMKAGFIEYAGWWEDMLVLENITASIEKLSNKNLRLNKNHIGKMFVDGKGATRIVDEILKINEI
jgi:UDP-2,4-diacetamido-2,4,6-trideoxy-beta-L-altropyranose hydrolase